MPLKIPPAYLRKIGIRDPAAIDLSRPTVENRKAFAGLGITSGPHMYPEWALEPKKRTKHKHKRTVSDNTKASGNSGLQRPSAPYMPSICDSSRPFTPPPAISKSTPASLKGNTTEADADITPTAEELQYPIEIVDWTSYQPLPRRRSGSLSSGSPALRLITSGSTSRLGSYSQTSLSLTSPVFSGRSRGASATMDSQSPSTRTSLDKALGFIHPRRNESPLDPEDRAAAIRDARRIYKEKQAAKDKKNKLEAQKKALSGSKSSEHVHPPASVAEPQGPYFPEYDNEIDAGYAGGFVGAAPYHGQERDEENWEKSELAGVLGVRKSKSARSRWMRFVTWLQTRVFKMKRNIKRII
jgi:hypothetical protein